MIPDNTDDDQDGYCVQCGETIGEGSLCESCRWGEEHAPEERDEVRTIRWGKCEVCGRGLNAEDEAMNNGMCIPCANE